MIAMNAMGRAIKCGGDIREGLENTMFLISPESNEGGAY